MLYLWRTNLLWLLTNNLLNFLNGLVHLHFLECPLSVLEIYQVENLKLVSQQYRAWSDCRHMQTGLALQVAKANYFGSIRVRVNFESLGTITLAGDYFNVRNLFI